MNKIINRRSSFRMPFVSRLVVQEKGSEWRFEGTLRNISIIGLFAEMAQTPTVGNTCDVSIYFEGNHSRLVIENVRGRVVRSDSTGIAVQFDHRMEWFILIPLYFHKISAKLKSAAVCSIGTSNSVSQLRRVKNGYLEP